MEFDGKWNSTSIEESHRKLQTNNMWKSNDGLLAFAIKRWSIFGEIDFNICIHEQEILGENYFDHNNTALSPSTFFFQNLYFEKFRYFFEKIINSSKDILQSISCWNHTFSKTNLSNCSKHFLKKYERKNLDLIVTPYF